MNPLDIHQQVIFKWGEALEMVPETYRVECYLGILLGMLAEKDNENKYLKKRLEKCQHCCKDPKNG